MSKLAPHSRQENEKEEEGVANMPFDRCPVRLRLRDLLLGGRRALRDGDRNRLKSDTAHETVRDAVALAGLLIVSGSRVGKGQLVAQDSFSPSRPSASVGPQDPRSYRNAGLSSLSRPSTTRQASITSS